MKRITLFLATTSLFLACGDTGTTEPDDTPTYGRDVKPILDGRCVSCHTKGNIAPFSLTTYDEAASVKDAILAAVETRTMPPWGAAEGHVDYAYDPSLTDEQIATIARWVDAGAPEGDPSDEGEPLPSVKQKLSRVDLTLSMPEAYVPQEAPDEYRCFILDWPVDETVYVTGFDTQPGSTKIDHHVAAFLVTPDNPLGEGVFDSLAELDAQDEAPGYKCFGGPAGESGLQIPAQQIGQWVPGQGGGDFPAGTGIKVPAGSKVVLQMHYNIGGGTDIADLTKIDLKLDDTVERPAAFAPWLNVSWVFGQMQIPAGDADVTHTHTADPRGFFKQFIGDTDVSEGFTIHAVMLHMHRLGVTGEVAIERKNGDRDVILEVPAYDFHWQRLYQLEEPVEFHVGDKMTVSCNWNNSQENQPVTNGNMTPPIDVNWGEGTVDEMCVGNLYIAEP